MNVDPAVAALRSDKASQRLLRAKMDSAHNQWMSDRRTARILDDLKRYSEGTELAQLDVLTSVLNSLDHACAFVRSWQSAFTRILRQFPLSQVPFPHHYADGFVNIHIANIGGASLSLSVYEEKPLLSSPRSAVFANREIHEIVLFGSGRVRLFRLERNGDGTAITSREAEMRPGISFCTNGSDTPRQVTGVSGRLVVLKLSRLPEVAEPTREYSIETGQLLKQSSGNKRASQQEMAIAVLTAMDRKDAAPTLADMTRAGPDHLRWEALRHALALDFAEGWNAFESMAGNANDPLSTPADQLRERLLSTYPELKTRQAA